MAEITLSPLLADSHPQEKDAPLLREPAATALSVPHSCKAHQTIPDTLSGMELTALLTPLLPSHACYPQSSSLHHLNSLQLQFMPLSSYCGLIREGEQMVTILI